MKKGYTYLLIAALVFVAFGCAKEEVAPLTEDTIHNDVELEESLDLSESIGYELNEKVYEDNDSNIVVRYPEMQGYRGELLQDYMNQSLEKIISLYGQNGNYKDIDITYEVTKMDNDLLSVVFRGKGIFSGQREFKILKSMNLDVGKSSNEINYSNLIKDDTAMRQILSEKVIELGLAGFFEAEGISVYLTEDEVVFYYMPLDDMAVNFIEIPVDIENISELLNWNFGEAPAS